jgi:diguanylate cyclase (GGDEF)-like protein/PAS domain S-box-containing protein
MKVVLEEAGHIGMRPLVNSDLSGLESFMHSIEQLRRLHSISRDEINSELSVLKARSETDLLVIFAVAVLVGSLIVWGTLRKIRGLVETQRQTESALRQSSRVFDSAAEGVVITDINANITSVNRAFTKITGYSENEVLGKNPSMLRSGRHDREFYKTMWSSILRQGEWRGEVWDRRKNGEIFPKWQTISAVRDEDGNLTHYVSVFSDISQLKESEEKLHHLAHHDALTALPNRLLLDARLEHSLQHAHRVGAHVAVLFLDLDRFKKINDSLGHSVGDELLQLVAKRLLTCIRGEDTIARLGGDELVIVLGHMDKTDYAATIAQAVQDTLSAPFELEGQDVFVSASIGISLYPQDGRDATTLLKNADAAMYMAKSEGRNGFRFYSKELTVSGCDSLALESRLYRAVESEQLLLHFQPQVSLKSGNIVGVEALLRWQHPQLGLLPPAKFIHLAEENGLIEVIGKWVLHSACTQAKAWQKEGLAPFRIAVNISERQLRQNNIIQEIRDVLEDTGLEPHNLELELTESSVMKRAERAAKTLDALRELGTSIAIDDFGTGYSSLSYLKRFSVDRLKIDRSFVRDIPQDASDIALAKSIIALGHSLKLSVVAEGVETQAQRELLTSIGCDEMQGFLYSAPRPASELTRLLNPATQAVCVND